MKIMTEEIYNKYMQWSDRPRLIDGLDNMGSENTLHCSCGQEIFPDCDMSRVSINQTYEDHVLRKHPLPEGL